MNEYVTLEFYELGQDGKIVDNDPIMYASNVTVVPRKGDKLYLARTEKILGVDPDKEHRNWEVVDVEWWYQTETDTTRKYGCQRQIAIFCRRISNDRYS